MIKENVPTLKELLTKLSAQGQINRTEIERIEEHFGTEQISDDPLFIRILTGTGSWFTAIFLILFLFISKIIDSHESVLICGLIFLAAAIVISRASKAIYLSQLSLALAIAGNILVLLGAVETVHKNELAVSFFTQALICAAVYPLYSSNIFRFLAPSGISIITLSWIFEKEAFGFIHILIAAEILLTGILFLRKKRSSFLAPLAYSAVAMLPLTILIMNLTQIHLWQDNFNEPLWPSCVLLSCGLIYLFIHLAGGMKNIREPWLILALSSTVFLGIFTTPGILVAIGLLVMGYAFGDRILSSMSHLFMPCFLILFYYALNIDLAHKSYIIAASGLFLLAVRWVAMRIHPEGVTH